MNAETRQRLAEMVDGVAFDVLADAPSYERPMEYAEGVLVAAAELYALLESELTEAAERDRAMASHPSRSRHPAAG